MNTLKEAAAVYPIHELIRNRWSARSFTGQPVAQELLMQLFEAASWSFSANNSQPWQYIYAHRADAPAFEKLFNCLAAGNQPWAKKASVLILALAKVKTEDGKPLKWAYHDLGAANMCLMLEATANGLHGHPMAGFDANKAAADFNIPDGYEPHVMIALGYLNLPEMLDEPFKTRETTPRTRKPLSEFVFQNKY
ncbi:nitroreductase [Sphingobacteriales bacterium UPWRP_1]|nr:hypothetical protein BVG80_13695 [Sphingobacteriales bacterium TSM_CSM]PSJ75378.1 nitroreductase [Sphingobacteriales bacterium UPWRP_1]